MESQLKGGKATSRSRLFAENGAWRYCGELTDAAYIDTVLAPHSSWKLSDQGVIIYDTQTALDDSSQLYRPRTNEYIFLPEIDRFLHGGLGIAARAHLTPGLPQCDGSNWRVRCSRESGGFVQSVDFKGRWDETLGRGFVESSTIAQSDGRPETVGCREEFLSWELDAEHHRWIAREVRRFDHRGRHWRTSRLEALLPMPPGGFSSLVAIPTAGRDDPIRGSVNFTTIADYRSGELTHTEPDGKVTTRALPAPAPSQSRNAVQKIGWSLLAAIGGFALIVVLRRRVKPG